jgi:tetratricopeptide (TPR) repeat protein
LSPSQDEAQTWLRRGNEAFGRGDYLTAIAEYEKAESVTTDPAQAAFNLAAARYFLALSRSEGRNSQLHEAELLYRCCLDPDDPRHIQALYGLGTCLLQSAGSLGVEELNQAIGCFDRCLELSQDAQLLAQARHNREAARLRLAQVQPAPERNPDTPNQERPRPDRSDPRSQNHELGDGGPQGRDRRAQRGNATPASPDGDTPRESANQPLPGKGNLPPVPDDATQPPLSPRDAAEHLEQASRRILEEEKSYRQQRARAPLAGIRDW